MSKRNTQRPITPLRQRMIEDMTIRNLSATTQVSYVHWVKSFALHCSATIWVRTARQSG